MISMLKIVHNEKGVALVLALVMIVVMTLLGVFALSTTEGELGIVNNYKSAYAAFYNGDAAMEYGQTAGDIYSTITPGGVERWPDHPTNYNTLVVDDGDPNTTNYTADVRVDYITKGALPPGVISDPELFQAFYFLVSVKGTGPNNAEAPMESQIARVVPK